MLATLTLLALGGVSIALPSSATSTGLEIAVHDIAEVTGDDAAAVARVKAASLGYAPAPGYHRTLRADLIRASLRQSLPGIDITVEGAPRCRVTPAVHVLTGDSLRAEAGQAMRLALGGLDASATPVGHVADLQMPVGEFEPRLVAKPARGPVLPGRTSVPVEVWMGAKLYRTISVDYQVEVWRLQAVLKRAVNAGEPLHRGLFSVKRTPVGEAVGLNVLDLDQLAGSVALHALPAGAAISERDVHREVIVRRGDTLSVRVTKGAVSVSDVGIAMADARMGERVRVALRSTRAELVATVRGRQSVEVIIQ